MKKELEEKDTLKKELEEKDTLLASETLRTNEVADFNRQLDVEKNRVVDIKNAHDMKIQSMKAQILQARTLESGLLSKVLENSDVPWPLDGLYKLATDLHTRLSKMRERVLPQESPSTVQKYFGFYRKSVANGGQPDREFLLQVLKDVNDELFDLEEKHGILADDDVVLEATSSASVGTTRSLEGGADSGSSPKRARANVSVNISPG